MLDRVLIQPSESQISHSYGVFTNFLTKGVFSGDSPAGAHFEIDPTLFPDIDTVLIEKPTLEDKGEWKLISTHS